MKIRIVSVPSENAAKWSHAYGGKLFPWGGSFVEDPNMLEDKNLAKFYFDAGITEKGLYDTDNPSGLDADTEAYLDSFLDAQTADAQNEANNSGNFGSNSRWARFAPVIGGAMQTLSDAFGITNKEDYTNPNLIRRAARQIRNVSSRPIGNYMTYNPMDTDYLLNRLQNQNLGLQRGALDMTSGNAGAARNAMLYSNRVVAEQEGDAYRKALEYNDERRRAIQQFNTGIDQFNAQQGLHADVYNQRRDETILDATIKEAALRDQIESALSAARSGNYTNFLTNTGKWGNDRLYADMERWYLENVAPYNQATQRYRAGEHACGGKLTRVKEFKRRK